MRPGRLRNFTHCANVDETAWPYSRAMPNRAGGGALARSRHGRRVESVSFEGRRGLATGKRSDADGQRGSVKAVNPAAFLKPRKYTVNTRTRASFLWIRDAVLAQLEIAQGWHGS